ncbi:MAG: hypothetical protein KF699_16730 [Phycisphaeraceae bacterium]|nr:hypothetical protein [Phycisphaeraceae bacterium]
MKATIASDRANELARAGAPFEQQWAALAEGMKGANDPPPNEPAEGTKFLRENVLDPGRTWCERAREALRAGGAKGLDAATHPNAAGQARSIELHTKLQDAERVFVGLTAGIGDPRFIIDADAASMADLGTWFARTRDELGAVIETRGLDAPADQRITGGITVTPEPAIALRREIRAWVGTDPTIRRWLLERWNEALALRLQCSAALIRQKWSMLSAADRLSMHAMAVIALHDVESAEPIVPNAPWEEWSRTDGCVDWQARGTAALGALAQPRKAGGAEFDPSQVDVDAVRESFEVVKAAAPSPPAAVTVEADECGPRFLEDGTMDIPAGTGGDVLLRMIVDRIDKLIEHHRVLPDDAAGLDVWRRQLQQLSAFAHSLAFDPQSLEENAAAARAGRLEPIKTKGIYAPIVGALRALDEALTPLDLTRAGKVANLLRVFLGERRAKVSEGRDEGERPKKVELSVPPELLDRLDRLDRAAAAVDPGAIDRAADRAAERAAEKLARVFGDNGNTTTKAIPTRTEVVLWEGAAHTDRNIRLARTRSAYLEAHGNVTVALAALKADGYEVSRSTFYNHLDALDNAKPRWRESVQLSNPTGNLDRMRKVGTPKK